MKGGQPGTTGQSARVLHDIATRENRRQEAAGGGGNPQEQHGRQPICLCLVGLGHFCPFGAGFPGTRACESDNPQTRGGQPVLRIPAAMPLMVRSKARSSNGLSSPDRDLPRSETWR